MDLPATQIYEDEDCLSTQRISKTLEAEGLVQVGTLSINSTEYQIKKGITKIGRLSSCDIVINDATVSKLHAEIEAASQRSTWICDLNSSNKTKLNNLILRPNRSYELKNGSIIEFGRVRATYCTYCPTDDTVIPETPAPPRQRIAAAIIPTTPDSSLNNSSGVDDDGSVILGTQRNEANSVFRRPSLLPQQRQSTSIDKRNSSRASSMSASDDSQIATVLHASATDVSESQEVSIFDVETQRFEGKHKTACSIHDVETQGFPQDAHIEANTDTSEPSLNIRNETADSTATDIHDMETQSDIDNTDKDGNDTQKSKIDQTKSCQENLDQTQQSIHDIETQKFGNECIVNDIAESQLELADHNTNATKDIEIQLKSNSIANGRADKNKNKDNVTGPSETNIENVTNISKSRSNSPASLNLSSPGINENNTSLPLNESSHLLETTDLLEYFSEGIDKSEEVRASNASTPKPRKEASSKRDNNAGNTSNASDMEDKEEDEDNIYDAPTQRSNCKSEASLPDDEKKDVFVLSTESKKAREKFRLEKQNDPDDSETDAEEYLEELAKEQREESTSASHKLCDESTSNRNDPGTSVESVDMFDLPTQRLSSVDDAQDTSNPLVNQPTKINEIDAIVNDMAPTQILKKIEDKCDQDKQSYTLPLDMNDAPTQLIVPHKILSKTPIISKNLSSNNNRTDDWMILMDNTMSPQIINVNNTTKSTDRRASEDDYENADYELAPTQVIGEIENEDKKNSEDEQANLDDTLERNLNQMFESVNNDIIHEPQKISTQCLENILESQNDNDLSTNEFVADAKALTNNTPQIQSRRKTRATDDRSSRDEPATKDTLPDNGNINNVETDSQNSDIYFSTLSTKRKRNIIKDIPEFEDSVNDTLPDNGNVNNIETDSQNSDIYFSTLSTKRKRNIIKDTLEFEDSVNEMISSRRHANSSKQSETNDEEVDDDNIITRSNRRGKRIPKNKTGAVINDDDVSKTVSNKDNKRNLRKSRVTRQTTAAAAASETGKQVLKRDSDEDEIDDAEKDLTSDSNICASCSSGNEQSAQTLDISYESDDDILTRLPAVRISGTLSNPASPSVSSISISSHRSKQDATTNEKNKKNKSLTKQNVENIERNENLNQTSDNKSSVLLLDSPKSINVKDISDEDSDTSFKRFKQMADRIFNNELHYLKPQSKENAQNTKKSVVLDGKKNARSLPDASEDPEQNTDIGSKNSPRISTRATRHSNKQNDETHSCVSQKEVDMENTIGKLSKSTTKSTIANRKRSLIEENEEQINSKKRKADKTIEEHSISTHSLRNRVIASDKQLQSPNMLEHSAETDSRETSPVIETRFSAIDKTAFKTILEETQKTLHPKMPENVYSTRSKEARRKSNSATMDENSDKAKQAPTEIEKVGASQIKIKTLRILLSPVTGNESQEVEVIMREASRNVQNESTSIRERSNVNILQRQLRTRSRKRPNADAEENSISTQESSVSSIDNSDSAQSDNSAPRMKRGRSAKKVSVPSPSKAKVAEKEKVFKKPVLDSSIGNSSTDENSEDNTRSSVLSNSRSSRSKAASIKEKEKLEMRQNSSTIDDSISFRTSVENTSLVSTPSRTRRSVSILNNSSPTATRHKILFTGVAEDYSKMIKILGGNKVEDPAKCTILVTDKVRRTYKFLCALANGIPIVSIDWLKDSESATQFLDWKGYILKDPAAEAKFGFRLRKSLDKAKEKKLLDGYTVILTSGVAPPPIEELKDMVTSCGGRAMLRAPSKWPERAVIVSREEDLMNARKFLAKAPKTVTVQSTEFILTGILRQETEFDKYKLI